MKHYTDLEQSKKLAEILPLESADMHYSRDFDGSWFVDLGEYTLVKIPKYVTNIEEHLLPCWSLGALLDVLPKYEIINFGDSIQLEVDYYASERTDNETLIDIVVKMIISLHESNLL